MFHMGKCKELFQYLSWWRGVCFCLRAALRAGVLGHLHRRLVIDVTVLASLLITCALFDGLQSLYIHASYSENFPCDKKTLYSLSCRFLKLHLLPFAI
jgi:hypothetical protein